MYVWVCVVVFKLNKRKGASMWGINSSFSQQENSLRRIKVVILLVKDDQCSNSVLFWCQSRVLSLVETKLLYDSWVCYYLKFKSWLWMNTAQVISKQRYSSIVRKALELIAFGRSESARWVILIKFPRTDIMYLIDFFYHCKLFRLFSFQKFFKRKTFLH